MPTKEAMQSDFMGLVAKASRNVAHGSTERDDAAICWAGQALSKLKAENEQMRITLAAENDRLERANKWEARANELMTLLRQIHDALEYGTIYMWDDGSPCWDAMRKEVGGGR